MPNYTFMGLKAKYTELWANMDILPARYPQLEAIADRIISYKNEYLPIQDATGVPWYVIGLIHLRESNLNFKTHLHNGDPLNARTTHVPKGYPRTGSPPFTFEYSAIDALKKQGLDKITDWSIERIAYMFEAYNGFGYQSKRINSPYLWSGTDLYIRGKYIKDGPLGWAPTVVDKQPGVMPVLKIILDKDKLVILPPIEDATISPAAVVERPTTAQMNVVSRKHWWNDLLKWTGIGGTSISGTYQALRAVDLESTKSTVATIKEMSDMLGLIALITMFVGIIIYAIYQSKLMKDDVQEGRAVPSGEDKNAI